jgi:glycosyltransferase involved in cell wall biosynthesis
VSDRVFVSIGIPFLNARRYLADAVRSVFAQTYDDWELLLVDDGSSDGSLDVVRDLDDPRVRILSDGSHRGLCARLNQIASLAQGTYLARMDADDLMHPERLGRQIAFLRANRRFDVIDTATFTVDDDLKPLGIRGDHPLDPRAEVVLRNGLLVHPTIMGKVDWFRSNPYDSVYIRAEDRELWSRTCATTTFGRLCEPLFFYREGPAGNLPNYLRTEKSVRAVLQRYGPSLVGGWRTRLLVMRSRLKSMAYCLITALGRQDLLIKRRNRGLTVAEAGEARRILLAIRTTRVSGLDSVVLPPLSRRPLRGGTVA